MRELRSSTTGNGWTINFDDIAEIVMEVRGGLSEISMEQVEDIILALGKLGYLKMPNPERSGPTNDAASKPGVDGSADATCWPATSTGDKP